MCNNGECTSQPLVTNGAPCSVAVACPSIDASISFLWTWTWRALRAAA